MFAQPAIAWYRGRHALNGRGDDIRLITFIALFVAILTMIPAWGAWLHPFAPNQSGPVPSGSTGAPSQPVSTKAIDFALSQIGAPYAWGSTGPYKNGYDSPGLVQAAWAHAGVMIPHSSYADWAELPHISKANIRPGDLLLYDDLGHVAIYIGHNDIIDAPFYGANVSAVPMSRYAHEFDGAVRP